MKYRFGVYELDTRVHELRRAHRVIPLQPKVFQVLLYLIEQRDRLVTRHELLECLWPNQFVDDSVVARCIMAARRALSDHHEEGRSILTLRGQGYRFVAAVTEHPYHSVGSEPSGSALPASQLSAPPGLPDNESGVRPRMVGATSVAPGQADEQQRLLPGTHDVERKPVTVLCCTLAGIASLPTRRRADVWHTVLHPFLDMAVLEARRYGGVLQHVHGNSFLVLFGAPIAQEHHAQRAVLTAVGLQQRLQALHGEVGVSVAPDVTIHIGLHTGSMLVGRMVDEAVISYVTGDIATVASQLAAGAAPQTIVLSAATTRHVRDHVRLRRVDVPQQAGVGGPREAYQVLACHATWAQRGRLSHRAHTRFVGRKRELATLHDLLALAGQGRGQAVHIVGEPGIGKSRLLYELQHSLRRRGVTYLRSVCQGYGQPMPWRVLLDLVRHSCDLTAEDSADVITAKVTRRVQEAELAAEHGVPLLLALLHMLDEPSTRSGVPAQGAIGQAGELLQHMLLCSSRRQPVILEVEDLHWIDPMSEAWLLALVDHLPGTTLFLITTARPGYRPPWLARSSSTQLALQPLSDRDSRHMEQALLHTTALPRAVVDTILAQASGNPFFLQELFQHACSQQAAQGSGELPDTILAVFAARLDQLPVLEKHLLQIAAVIGTTFALALLQIVSEVEDTLFQDSLQHLQAVELLYETQMFPKPMYAFRHSLMQEVAYTSLPQWTQRHLHLCIAQALVAHFPEVVDTEPARLAQHYTAAERGAEALEYWQRAGQLALEHAACVEAISHLTQGLAILRTLPETPSRHQHALRLHLMLGSAMVAHQGFLSPEVEEVYRQARVLCLTLDDTTMLFSVLYGLLEHALYRAELDKAHALSTEFWHVAQRLTDRSSLLHAHHLLGALSVHRGEFALGRWHLEQGMALDAAWEGGTPRTFYGSIHPGVGCRNYLALTLWLLGYPDQALQSSREALARAEALAHPLTQTMAELFAAIVMQHCGELQHTEQLIEHATAHAIAHQFTFCAVFGAMIHGWVRVAQGQHDAGLAQLTQTLPVMRALGTTAGQIHAMLSLVDAYRQVGQLTEGLPLLTAMAVRLHTTGERCYEAEVHRLLGESFWHSPTPATVQAEQELHHALEIATRQGAQSLALRAALGLSGLWYQQGKHSAARALIQKHYQWFTEGFETADLRQARRLLTMLA